MTVDELIGELLQVKDRHLPVFIYNVEDNDIHKIHFVDILNDRVDLNTDIK